MASKENYGEVPDLEVESDIDKIVIQLKVNVKVAYRAVDDFEKSHIQKEEDGSVILTVKLPYDNWIITYILSYGTDAEILKPLWLKEEIRKLV